MSAFVVWIAAVLAFALLWWIFRRRSAPARTAQRATHPAELTSRTPSADLALRARTGSTEGAIPSSVAANWQPPAPSAPPAELTELDWLRASNLDAARRDQLLQAIRGIPRPPRSLQQLLSPEFVAKADSADRPPGPGGDLPGHEHGAQHLPAVHAGRSLQAGPGVGPAGV
ncbi:MAG: hypothetical protein MUF55_03650 [Hydrogenophaga sp.]|nr:hypothetical protein [Hydrogenophaga sp.]